MEQPHYRQRIVEVREMLKGQYLEDIDLYEIASQLNMVFNDSQFKDDMDELDRDPVDVLDKILTVLDINFLELRALLESHPVKEEWSARSNCDLLAEGRRRPKQGKRRTMAERAADLESMFG